MAVVALALLVTSNIDVIGQCSASSVRECGVQLGRSLAKPLAASIERTAEPLRPFLLTDRGAEVFDKLWRLNSAALPSVAAELEGLAEGANVDARDAITSSLATELSYFAKQAGINVTVGKSCSDYHSLGGSRLRAWVHNEDGFPDDEDETFLVDTNVSGVRRISFVYGHDAGLGGWAWSANSHGVAHSVNALYPTNATFGIGAAWLARHVADATSLDDAVARACDLTSAGGQHFNVGSIREPGRQLMIEVLSDQGCDVRTLAAPVATGSGAAEAPADDDAVIGYHANLYESAKFKGSDGGIQPSSSHRMARMAVLPGESTADLEAVVSDVHDPQYPIHRSDKWPDPVETLNSVLFDVSAQTISVWGRTAPTVAKAPSLRIDWRTMEMARTMKMARTRGVE